jgi:hypothetical protein
VLVPADGCRRSPAAGFRLRRRLGYPSQASWLSTAWAGCPSGQRERSVKPSAQPTLVRIQHLPPPAKTAPGLHICGKGLALAPPRSSRLNPAIGGCIRNHGETALIPRPRPEAQCRYDCSRAARDRRCIRRRHGAGPRHHAQRGGRPRERARQRSGSASRHCAADHTAAGPAASSPEQA